MRFFVIFYRTLKGRSPRMFTNFGLLCNFWYSIGRSQTFHYLNWVAEFKRDHMSKDEHPSRRPIISVTSPKNTDSIQDMNLQYSQIQQSSPMFKLSGPAAFLLLIYSVVLKVLPFIRCFLAHQQQNTPFCGHLKHFPDAATFPIITCLDIKWNPTVVSKNYSTFFSTVPLPDDDAPAI